MDARQTQKTDRREMISFLVSDQEYCVDIDAVREIRGWTPVTPIAQSADYVPGVINLRGAVTPVIDLRLRLGFAAIEPSTRNVIIVAEAHGRRVGLVVDAVCETFVLSAADLQAPPALMSDRNEQFVSAIAMIETRLLAVLNLDAVAPFALSAALSALNDAA